MFWWLFFFVYICTIKMKQMKKSAAQIRVNETIKFSDTFGTHILKVTNTNVSQIYKSQVEIAGDILSTTCKSTYVSVGSDYNKYFRFKTKVETITI